MVLKWKLWTFLIIINVIYSENVTKNVSQVNFFITNNPIKTCFTNKVLSIPEGDDLEFNVNVPDPRKSMRCQIHDKIGEFFKDTLFKNIPNNNQNYITYSTVLKATKQIEGKWSCYVSLRSLHRENVQDIVCEVTVNILGDHQKELVIDHKDSTSYQLYYIIGLAVAVAIILLFIIVVIIQAIHLKRYKTLISENPGLIKMDSMPKPKKDRNCYSIMPTERRLSKKHERADSSIYHSVGDVSTIESSPKLSGIADRPPMPLPEYDSEHIYDDGSQGMSPPPPTTLPKPSSKKGPVVQPFKPPKTKQMLKLNKDNHKKAQPAPADVVTNSLHRNQRGLADGRVVPHSVDIEHEQYDYTDTVELVRNQNSLQRPPKNLTATPTLSRDKDWKERDIKIKPKTPASPGIDSSIVMSELESRIKNKNKPTPARPAPPPTASKPVLPGSKVIRNQGQGHQLPLRSAEGYQDSMKRRLKVEELPRQIETRSPPVLRVQPMHRPLDMHHGPTPPLKPQPHTQLPIEDTEELYQEVAAEDITDNSDDEWCYEALQKFDDK